MSNPIVFSTDPNLMKQATAEIPAPPLGTDILLTIKCQKKGRAGKTVSLVQGFHNNQGEYLLQEIKKACGCGGSYKEQIMEVQGDKRTILREFLVKKGFKVKVI